MTSSPGTSPSRAVLVALTPEARAALGSSEHPIHDFPFRVGRESRSTQRTAARVVTERRRTRSRPNNDVYLEERGEPLNVSREHFLIEYNGTHYVLVDRQSACGTLVEGTLIGGKNTGGAVRLADGDVIIVGGSISPFVFKFRVR
jgi:pSer/pThr/pTyr-binding forkhead associated (FHA) protein